MTIYIIEHLEKELWPWCIIEYEQISKTIGKEKVWFTNIKARDKHKLSNFGKVFVESVKTLNLKRTCILDPDAKTILKTSDKDNFDYFVFGGILGDNPPRKRTYPELTIFMKNSETRNIGKEQFSTDNAVFVVNEILKGKKFEEMNFIDEAEIKLNKIESIGLPYRYPILNGKPRISKKLISYLKKNQRI